jgi:hypothetical protein
VQNAAVVSGVQPHVFCIVPPPHVWGAWQVPQSRVRIVPQLSAAV